MPDLDFAADGAEPVPYSATPLLALKLSIRNRDSAEVIRSVALQCQVLIEAPRRQYSAEEKAALLDLFDVPERWGQTLRNTLWTHASVNVAGFQDETTARLPVPCTFDFNVAATKYFHALKDGVVPLCLLFSGTVFYQDNTGSVQIAPIPWNKEAHFKMPVETWKQVIDRHYPNTAWLHLRRDTFNRLHRYKMQLGVATWEEALDRLLSAQVEEILI